MPYFSLSALGTPKCVMEAGCETSVSQVPRDTALTQSFNLLMKVFPASTPPFNSKLNMAPGCFICFCPTA